MRRSHLICWGLIVSLCVATGCSTSGRRNPLTALRGKKDKADRRDEQLADSTPFRRDDAVDSQSLTAKDRRISHDAETRALIQSELSDATPEERSRLLADFEDLDPRAIRMILKFRRTQRQLEQERQQVATVSNSQSTKPYDTLGTGFPGSNGGITAPGPSNSSLDPGFASRNSVQPSAVPGSEPGRNPNGLGFGHSSSVAQQSPTPVINPLRGGIQQTAGIPQEGYQSPAIQPGMAQQQYVERPANAAAVFGDTYNPSTNRTVIPAGGQVAYPQPGQVSPARHTADLQPHPDAAQPQNGALNPLQFVGIDTSPGNRTFGRGNLPAAAPPNVGNPQWHDALQRMIAVAEEQAYAAQTAWEQAEQSAANNNLDEAARRELTEAVRQEYVTKQVDLRMLYLMSGQQARALERVRGLDAADQEFWTQVMWSLANYFDVEGIPNRDERATQTVIQMRSAIQHLQQTAKLEIRNVDFCTKISSFGNYETFDNNVFRPGQPVMVYAEIDNFSSKRGSDGLYRTQLKSTIEVHRVTPQGSEVVETLDFDATTDLCRHHRRDYYHSFELNIPSKATTGSYALVLIVEDQYSKRVATYSRNFAVE